MENTWLTWSRVKVRQLHGAKGRPPEAEAGDRPLTSIGQDTVPHITTHGGVQQAGVRTGVRDMHRAATGYHCTGLDT